MGQKGAEESPEDSKGPRDSKTAVEAAVGRVAVAGTVSSQCLQPPLLLQTRKLLLVALQSAHPRAESSVRRGHQKESVPPHTRRREWHAWIYFGRDVVVQWCSGAVVQWCSGAVVPRFEGLRPKILEPQT